MSRALTASDRSSHIKLASSLEKGSEERRAILAGLKRTGGADKSVWMSVPRKMQGIILEHLGAPRQPGVSDPIPFFSGFPRRNWKSAGRPISTSKGTFTLGFDGNEPVVQWEESPGVVSYFLPPAL